MRTVADIEKDILTIIVEDKDRPYYRDNTLAKLANELIAAKAPPLVCEPPYEFKHLRYHFVEGTMDYKYKGSFGKRRSSVPFRYMNGMWSTYAGVSFSPYEMYHHMHYRYLGPAIYKLQPSISDEDIAKLISNKFGFVYSDVLQVRAAYSTTFNIIKTVLDKIS